MKQLRRFLVAVVLMAGATFAFSSCDKDEEKTEQGSGSDGKDNENGKNNGGENGGDENGGDNGGENEGDENDGNNNDENGAIDLGGTGVIDGYEYVDLGMESGTLWATCNVGAKMAEEYGDYFAWGETATYEDTKRSSSWYGVNITDLQVKGVIDANENLEAKYDAATVNWGEGWRMPTFREILELTELESEMAEVNGVAGRMFMGKNGRSLFLPFAGSLSSEELRDAGEYGRYWSATAGGLGQNADYLYVSSRGAGKDFHYRDLGFCVRPVVRTK